MEEHQVKGEVQEQQAQVNEQVQDSSGTKPTRASST